MKAVNNGFIEIRGTSSETKPLRGTVIPAWNESVHGTIDSVVSDGDCFIETDTQKVMFMTPEGWV